MCCVKGKGHAVLPICWLQPQPLCDPITEEDGEASKGENENDVKVFVCVHACVHMLVLVYYYSTVIPIDTQVCDTSCHHKG